MNDPRGLEQGFTLEDAARRRGLARDRARDRRRFDGRVQAGRHATRSSATERRAASLHYSGLRAWDAERARARGIARASTVTALLIRVDDARPAYPLHVDPWIGTEEAKLTASDGAASDYFGSEVAISGDTAVIGATGRPLGWDSPARLGLRVRAQRNDLDRRAEAHRQRREAGGFLRPGRGHFGRHGHGRSEPGDDHAGGTDAGSVYVFVTQREDVESNSRGSSLATRRQPITSAVSIGLRRRHGGSRGEVRAITRGPEAGSAYVFVRSRSGLDARNRRSSPVTRGRWTSGSGLRRARRRNTSLVGARPITDRARGCGLGLRVRAPRRRLGRNNRSSFRRLRYGIRPTSDGPSPYREDTAVIGAYGDDNSGGSSRLGIRVRAQRDDLDRKARSCLASDATTLNEFGTDVAIDG